MFGKLQEYVQFGRGPGASGSGLSIGVARLRVVNAATAKLYTIEECIAEIDTEADVVDEGSQCKKNVFEEDIFMYQLRKGS